MTGSAIGNSEPSATTHPSSNSLTRKLSHYAPLSESDRLRWSRSFGQPGGPVKLIPGSSSCRLSDRYLLAGMPASR